MKRVLMGIFLTTIAISARAQSQPPAISSVTYGGVAISTSSATRVDNVSTAGSTATLSGRIELLLCSPAGNSDIYCGYDGLVSTNTASVYAGRELLGGACINVQIDTGLAYYCKAVGTSSQWIHVEQAAVYQARSY